MDRRQSGIVLQKRNLIAISVWCALLIALVAGITMNAVLYSRNIIDESAVYRRLLYAVLCFVMMSAVYLAEWIFHIRFPLFIELSLSVFAFIALAGGTVFGLYAAVSFYDKLLHFLGGILFSVFGLELADILLKNQPSGARKYVAMAAVAFFFVLSVGYIWEIYEYTVDSVIPDYDNQRWLAGVIEELENGTYLVSDRRGTALHDTMWDMICNLAGAIAFLLPFLIAVFKNSKILNAFRIQSTPKKKKKSA